jgi:undecaprenyl-diphosphatase
VILGNVPLDPEMIRSDAAISGYIQTLRTEAFTSVMVAVTMFGDQAVLLPVAIGLVVMLLAWRHRNAALSVAVAMLAATAFVPLMKSVMQRTRPMALYDGADSFSFPSGHSTISTVVLGLTALVFAHALPERFHRAVYLVTAGLIALVGFSRIYLLAHWPSDVLAGMLFGLALVFAMAILLHGRRLRVPARAAGLLTAFVLLLVYPAHLWTGYAGALARYAPVPVVTTLDRGDWLDTGWRRLPAARILLDGEFGEPMLLQTDIPREAVVTALRAAGWRVSTSSQLDDVVGVLLPSRVALADSPPLPMTHVGRRAVATLTRASQTGPDRLDVLRIWPSDHVVGDSATGRPLLLVSVTYEVLVPLVLGFGHVAPAAPDTAEAFRIANNLARTIGQPATRNAAGLPLLVPD